MLFSFPGRRSQTRDYIESVVRFLAQELKLENSSWALEVHTQRGMAKQNDVRGCVTRVGPKYLLMYLDSALDVERLTITIAHEMVHVKQYAKGQIQFKHGRKTPNWMGKKSKKHYYEQPWELEAFTKERILANKIFKICKM